MGRDRILDLLEGEGGRLLRGVVGPEELRILEGLHDGVQHVQWPTTNINIFEMIYEGGEIL